MTTLKSLIASPSGTPVHVEYLDEQTTALLFEASSLDEEWAEELEIWLETAEEEQANDDLLLIGLHPIDDDTQVERLFYLKASEGGEAGPVYSLDVDGTVVPGTLAKFGDSLSIFKPVS